MSQPNSRMVIDQYPYRRMNEIGYSDELIIKME